MTSFGSDAANVNQNTGGDIFNMRDRSGCLWLVWLRFVQHDPSVLAYKAIE